MPKPACLLDAFLDQSPGCHWITSTEGRFHRVYGDPSPVFARTASELTGRTAAETLDPDAARLWMARFERAFEGETFALRERRGEVTWYISVFPLRFDGEVYAGGLACESTAWSTAEHELRHTVLGALKTQEFERAMASKFLHDSIGQNLTAFGLQLDLIRMDLEPSSLDICARIAEIQQMLEALMESVREYSYELHPSIAERAGLRSALDRLTGRVRERFAGLLRINVDPSLKIEPKVASALYHIAQEAVENAVQHASCSSIEIAVKSTRTGSTSMEIRDNGRGFDPGDMRSGCRGLGLLSMEHHAAQAGLDLSVVSSQGTGTTVKACVPEAA